MSPLAIASTLFKLYQAMPGSDSAASASASSATQSANDADFGSSLALRMASLQAQSVNTLISSVSSAGSAVSNASDPLSLPGLSGSATGLSASGRNVSLFDPESAYKMMSVINRKDVRYKAQFAELSEMKDSLAGLQQAAQTLSAVSNENGKSGDETTVKAALQTFASQYNDWIARFDSTVKSGGVLAGTQAAEVSLYELKQSVENIFNGAKDGFHGLGDIGFRIDPSTRLATLNLTQLESALASKRDGVLSTIGEFGVNFAKSAELLTSANNFVPNRLANLDRTIDYIDQNTSAWQAEFGRGDAVQPSAQIAKALATYQQIYRA